MKINGFNRDPLAPAKHHVVSSRDGGKTFTILGETAEPIELLKLHVEGQHAVGMQSADVMIIDAKTREVEAKFDKFIVPERDPDEPPTEAFLKERNRWMDSIFKFLLPPGLYADKDDPERAPRLARWFKSHKIEISVAPNGAVRIFRDGKVLTEFGV